MFLFRIVLGGLRVRLILLVLLAVLPSLGLILYTNLQHRQNAKTGAQQDALRLVRVASHEQEHLIRSAKQLLIVLAQLPVVQDSDPTECQVLFTDLLAQHPIYCGFSVATLDGDVICSAPPVSTPVSFADRPWFQEILQTKNFVVSDHLIGRISGKNVIVLAYPILDIAKNLQAVVTMGLNLSWINQLFTEAELPSNSAYTVIDRNGTILVRYPDPEKWIGQPASDIPIVDEVLTEQGEGITEAAGVDGVLRLYAFAPLTGDPLPNAYVLIGIPKTVAYAEANRTLRTNLAVLGLVTILALYAAWFGGNVFILRHIRALVQATKRLESGDLSARTGLTYGVGELSQLSQAFDHMAETLELHDAEIKQADMALSKSNRALKMISICNQVLIRAEEEFALLREICQIIVDIGGYRSAWVGFAEHDKEKTIRPVAQAGYEEGYLDSIDISWADTEGGRGPTGTAIRTGKTVHLRDILTDTNFAPWRSEALKRGYASSIALPLMANTQILGALNIYAGEVDAFDPEEVKLLEELADDLAYGIVTLRMRTLHRQAEEKIESQLKNMAALRDIDMAISGSLDLRVTFNVLLDQVTSTLNVDAASILLLNTHTQELEFTVGRGFRTQALQHTSLPLGEGHAGRAALERRMVIIPDLVEAENGFRRSLLLPNEGFVTYIAMPLIVKGQVKGVLEIFHRTYFEPDQEWSDFLNALAMQAAIAIDNAALFDNLQQSNIDLMMAYDNTLEGWSRALDLRDRETEGHSKRVTEMTQRLARVLGIKEADLVHIRRGAMLHDMGKMGIPDSILLKPGPLNDEEWEIMHRHPTLAFEMLSPIAYLRPVLDIPYCHHEKWDGSGYPRGLKGDQIPLSARIFAVVDVWDALCSERPYRQAWSDETALAHIKEQAGKHFDPQVVETFVRVLEGAS